MLCDNCGVNEATTHIKRIVNGQTTQMHLCSKCAAKMGYGSIFGSFLTDLLSSVAPMLPRTNELRCKGCNSSFEEIAESGMMGCEQCYETFADRLAPSINRIHGRNRHIGKKGFASTLSKKSPAQGAEDKNKSAELTADERIADLKKQMDDAVSKQEYEKAAQLRDMIKDLEQEGNSNE
jgi:protein arginine kinase activator